MNSIMMFQADAFTSKPFSGNPAGVFILNAPRDSDWMQLTAKEMNLSETAFVVPKEDGFDLRWFTPAVEVDLCGHATLASAHILWQENYLSPENEAKFYTKSGILTARKNNDWIELNFPSEPAAEVFPPEGLLKALGIKALYSGKNRFDYLVEVESEETVRSLKPNLSLLSNVTDRGVIVTSLAANSEFDFVSRFFAPRAGINEDPVTGSAHCCLGPYWMKKLGRDTFNAFQASARGGTVRVRVDKNRVILGGQAVTVLKGEWKA